MSAHRGGVRLRRATVLEVRAIHEGLLELDVEIDGTRARALAYPDLVGPVDAGDTVVVNTTAVELELGTGGFHLVVAVEGASLDPSDTGRTMKLRYAPSQTAVRAVEETDRDVIEGSRGLAGTPVVCAPLHSMIAPVDPASADMIPPSAPESSVRTASSAERSPLARAATSNAEISSGVNVISGR